ncbi:HCLS1-associated protein X-1-like [Saccostrea echinata]|uniref:HCLS1-associated protein X-1-like n=1 Tax=Saccostrea echinata TaxID=191078 RepID=UPI002A7EDBC2|nr:HCLS1-associated protein X-1-like [Saccostrea echinata]
MGLGDMFHDFFFGSNKRRPGPIEDGDQLFKHGQQIPGNRRGRDEFEDFNSIFTESFGDMEKHMEMMQREMETIFRRFGAMDIPFDSFPERDPSRREDNPRDSMLKEADSPPESRTSPPLPQPWGHRHFFDDFFRKFDAQEPGIKEDKDLDKEAKDIDIAQVFTDPKSGIVPSAPQRGGIFSSGSSISVTTIRGADGRVEQKRTVRDSSGREETTVTRTVGDQTHTVITKVDPSGTPETTETFTNIDEGNKKDFNDKWDNSARNPSQPMLLPDNPQKKPGQPDDRSFYDRLFEMRLFGPKDDK